MRNEAIKNAMQLIEQGHINQGGPILINLLEYKRAEEGWAWLYSCVKTDTQKIYCIRKILEINPRHQKAQGALVELKLKQAKASIEFEIQSTNLNKKDQADLHGLVSIPVEGKEMTENENSATRPSQEKELANE